MLEKGLRRSLSISGGNPIIFFQSPIAIAFFILTIIAIITMSREKIRKTKSLGSC
jgi:TctA family transporter